MIIFIYGEDTYSSRKKLQEFKDKFLREVDASGNSLVTIEGENASAEKINETVSVSSLFARKRMVVVEGLLSGKNKAAADQILVFLKNNFGSEQKKLSDISADNIIIFWEGAAEEKNTKSKLFDFLSKQKFIYNFKKLSNTETLNWVKKETEFRGAKIKPQAASILSSFFSGNLSQLNNEIDKLINFKTGKNKVSGGEVIIDEEDISILVRGNIDENIFALTDAISAKNKALAMLLFEKELEAGVAEINLLRMIIRQFRILLLVRQCLDKSYTSQKITSQLKLHPFIIQKSLTQVRNFAVPTLKNILNRLIEIDRGIKTGQVDAKSALSILLAKI
jgi:DNA polymerase III subunit delta